MMYVILDFKDETSLEEVIFQQRRVRPSRLTELICKLNFVPLSEGQNFASHLVESLIKRYITSESIKFVCSTNLQYLIEKIIKMLFFFEKRKKYCQRERGKVVFRNKNAMMISINYMIRF